MVVKMSLGQGRTGFLRPFGSNRQSRAGDDGGQQGTALHKKVGLGPTKIPLGETLKKSPR